VKQSIASYVMTQHYVNIEDNPLETVFLFPMDIKSVISKLTCDFTMPDGKTTCLETHIEERQVAQAKYEDSIAQGKTAVYSF
jgi:hypothetical protein